MLALHGSEGKSGSEAERIGFSGLSGFFRILSGLCRLRLTRSLWPTPSGLGYRLAD